MTDQEWGLQVKRRAPDTAWMMTFADLLSLMLTFFVLLFSMSTIEQERWQGMTMSLSQRLNPDFISEPDVQDGPSAIFTVERRHDPLGQDLGYLEAVLREKLSHARGAENMWLQLMPGQLVLSIPSGDFFREGEAQMKPEAQLLLVDISAVLGSLNQGIGVYGFSQPDSHDPAVALGRAELVTQALQQGGYRKPVDVLARIAPAAATGPDLPPVPRIDIIISAARAS